MDRFRGSRFGANSSKASASTVCQKCLKRGHYSYECKATVQDRPYISRPSRTQQLLNPKLAPKLNDENPNKLLEKKGIADEILAKQAESRGRKRSPDDDNDLTASRKRSRSISSYTSDSDSVSTISTNASRPPSRSRSPPRRARRDEYSLSQRVQIPAAGMDRGRKRQRRSSSDSRGSHDSYSVSRSRERNTRKRHSSVSPAQRGRAATRSQSDSRSPRRGARRDRSTSYSDDEDYQRHHRGEGVSGHGDTAVAEHRRVSTKRMLSRSRSPYRRPEVEERGKLRVTGGLTAAAAPIAKKERSLSPFSKRVALTKAMNG